MTVIGKSSVVNESEDVIKEAVEKIGFYVVQYSAGTNCSQGLKVYVCLCVSQAKSMVFTLLLWTKHMVRS